MPRLVVRKSALSTTHYCRPLTVGNSSRNPKRQSSSVDEWDHKSCSPRPAERRRDRQGQRDVEGAIQRRRNARWCFSRGVGLVIRIFRFCRRTRRAFLIPVIILLFLVILLFGQEGELAEVSYTDADGSLADPSRFMRRYVEERRKEDLPAVAGPYHLATPNCDFIIDGSSLQIQLARNMLYREYTPPAPNSFFQFWTQNCTKFRQERHYPELPYTTYQAQFQLAYLIGVSSSADLVERLLRTVYVPQNLYCLYSLNTNVSYATSGLWNALGLIARCFQNVFITPEADLGPETLRRNPKAPYLHCLRALLVYPGWRTVLMTAEGDVPLHTNGEILESVLTASASWRMNSNASSYLPPLTVENDFSGYMLTRKMARHLSANERGYRRSEVLTEGSSNLSAYLKIRAQKACVEYADCALRSSELSALLKSRRLFARRLDLGIDHLVFTCIEDRLLKKNEEARKIGQ